MFWMGSEAKTEGVGIFVAEKWVDSVVSVERHSERILVLKMVLGDRLLNKCKKLYSLKHLVRTTVAGSHN